MKNINLTYLEKIIHEMNTPLHNLNMLPDLMLDDKISMSKSDKDESLRYIQDSAQKLTQLTKMLAAITNLNSEEIQLKFSAVDIINLVSKEIEYHNTYIKNDDNKQIQIIFNNKIRLAQYEVTIDQFWIGQLLSNIIVNAINHMNIGTIEVDLDLVLENKDQYFNLQIKDQGCGIPEKELHDIFQPLKRGSHSVGKVNGSGIGLAVAKEIVDAHNGLIEVSNNQKNGSTFKVIIPCYPRDDKPQP